MTLCSPTSAASTPARCTSGWRTTHWRSPAWRTRRTRGTVAAAARRTCSMPCISAISAAITARAAGSRDRPRPSPPATCAWKACARPVSRSQRPQADADVSLALPGLYNVYNALAAAALACALEVPLESIQAGLAGSRAAFGRAETVSVSVPAERRDGADAAAGTRELQILLVKNPAGANEVLRTLALEPGEHDLLGVLNDHIADGRDVSWIWDADFELLAGRIRRATCSGTRAADLAARLKYAGIEPERIARARGSRRRAAPRCSGPAARAWLRRCSRCPPTRRCWRCASCWWRAGRRAAHGREPVGQRSSGTTSSAAPTPRTWRCGMSSPSTPARGSRRQRDRSREGCSTSAPDRGA